MKRMKSHRKRQTLGLLTLQLPKIFEDLFAGAMSSFAEKNTLTLLWVKVEGFFERESKRGFLSHLDGGIYELRIPSFDLSLRNTNAVPISEIKSNAAFFAFTATSFVHRIT